MHEREMEVAFKFAHGTAVRYQRSLGDPGDLGTWHSCHRIHSRNTFLVDLCSRKFIPLMPHQIVVHSHSTTCI